MSDKKEIEFWAIDSDAKDIAECPEPASKSVPQWYKDLGRFMGSDKLVVENGKSNTGLKTCAPFLDAMIGGYIVKLHCDILVEIINDEIVCNWTSAISPMSNRGPLYAQQLPKVNGYGYFSQAWEMKYAFRVPKGYSVLVTQPINRFDSPIYVTSGVIDADTTLGPGGIPFAFKEGFEGIIPRGTPIAQLFPFKRDDWEGKEIEAPISNFFMMNARNKFYGWYKENVWKKKSYV